MRVIAERLTLVLFRLTEEGYRDSEDNEGPLPDNLLLAQKLNFGTLGSLPLHISRIDLSGSLFCLADSTRMTSPRFHSGDLSIEFLLEWETSGKERRLLPA